MSEDDVDRRTADPTAALDAGYEPFPALADWPSAVLHERTWQRHVRELDRLRGTVDPDVVAAATQVAIRAAAVDTGAIEGLYEVDRGFTLSVATQAAAWEVQIAERGSSVRDYFDAQLRTYNLVLDAVTEALPVTEAWIRRLHEELTGPQDSYRVLTPAGVQEHPLPHGEYKRHPNHVLRPDGSTHSYAPVEETQAEMGRLVEELRSLPFSRAHSVVQAAYAHYALVRVHPFSDGNGRVARALASVYLYRAARVPLLVFAERRNEYLGALEAADAGDRERFNEFAFHAALEAVDLVADTLRTAAAPSPDRAADELRELLTAQGGLTHHELDGVADRMLTDLQELFSERIARLELPPGVNGGVGMGSGSLLPVDAAVSGYRRPTQSADRYLNVSFHAQAPTGASAQASFRVLVSTARDESETFAIARDEGEAVTFALRDVYPTRTAAAEQRQRALVDRTLGQLLTDLRASAEQLLRRSGYQS